MLLSITLLPVTMTAQAASEEDVALPHPQVARIEVEKLRAMIEADEDIVVVDTRDALTYEDGHIPTAINIYYNPIADPTTREMFLVALPMNKPIIIYCP